MSKYTVEEILKIVEYVNKIKEATTPPPTNLVKLLRAIEWAR